MQLAKLRRNTKERQREIEDDRARLELLVAENVVESVKLARAEARLAEMESLV